MSSRGGRDRPRRDHPSRSEEKSHHGRSTAPPSRHLWVGNLSHSLTERALSNHFREFGELESVAFQPGRSYAFVNFIQDSAAFAAIGALQGFVLAGNALRIEFTKAEKSSTSSHDDDYLQRRTSPPPRSSSRDSRPRHVTITTNPLHQNENLKPNSKNNEPSEVLWVGFPHSLKVDENSLWNAFSPFGEINKISFFPGRTYAFIRYKNINSATRAKDNLQGKLFGNPRVHICFARSDFAGSNPNDPPSPRSRPYQRYHANPAIDRSRRSPRSDGYDDVMGFDRRLTGRFEEVGPDMYGRRRSLSRDRENYHDFPVQNFNRPLYADDEWDLPEDSLVYPNVKKPRTDPELPEYPFADSEQVKHVLPRIMEFPQHDMTDNINNNNLGHFGYHKQIPDPPVNVHHPYIDRGSSRILTYDNFQAGPVSLGQTPVEWKRPTPEPIPANDEWKWEGIIAKGGTPICRARCFPVGKVLDMLLPEFLDCTARTSLDMLTKHYYQAATSWVIFFVPESDDDMGYYNEFMNYLGEKQRAAVAKLDDKTTLFLVPPSDFSEKILKVPGKLSISGVILRLESSSGVENLPPPPPERQDPYLEASRTSLTSPFSNLGNTRLNNSLPGLPPGPVSFQVNRNMVDPVVEHTPDHLLHHQQQQQQQTHTQLFQNVNSGGRNPALARSSGGELMAPLNTHETSSSSNYTPGNPTMLQYGQQYGQQHGQQYGQQEVKPSVSSYMPTGVIPQDQLVQIASFLGNTRQQLGTSSGVSMGDEFRQSSNTTVSDNAYRMPQTPNNTSQFYQVQQFQNQQQVSNMNMGSMGAQMEFGTSNVGNAQEESEADPQKRLQATLELAATLLKQIQQGKS